MATGHINVNIKSKDKDSNGGSSISTSYYDVVIKSQAEFDNFVNTYGIDYDGPYVNVLFEDTGINRYEINEDTGIILSPKVKKIHAETTTVLHITTSKYLTMVLGYQQVPQEDGYEICNISIYVNDGEMVPVFNNCKNLVNCRVNENNNRGEYETYVGFNNCTHLINCYFYQNDPHMDGTVEAFKSCSYLINCKVEMYDRAVPWTEYDNIYAFSNCSYLINCIGYGGGTNKDGMDESINGKGYAYYNCIYCLNCTSTGYVTAEYYWSSDNKKAIGKIACEDPNLQTTLAELKKIRPTFFKVTGDVMADTGNIGQTYLISNENVIPANKTMEINDIVIFYTTLAYYVGVVTEVNGNGATVTVKQRLGYILPEITEADEGKVLKISSGKLTWADETI